MIIASVVVLLALAHFSRAAEICCGATGCFDDLPPFGTFPLPSCPADCNIRYIMYTNDNINAGVEFTEFSVPAVFDPALRTVFMAHGWNSDASTSWQNGMKDTLLNRGDMNVVVIDWGVCARLLNYNKAASNTRTVGAQTAQVFTNLINSTGGSATRMWCMGHSLGAHVCGHTGMHMKIAQLDRVTGLDPAGPLFQGNADKTVGINPSSGDFVDIIHTDVQLGTLRDLGHIDFYPSGGANQPGCALSEIFSDEAYEKMESDDTVDLYNSCDHARAYEFMQESIKNDCFRATQICTDYNSLPNSCTACTCGAFPCAFMGFAADSSCRRTGMHYLTVTDTPPFCTN